MWSIRQTDAGWEVLDPSGLVLNGALPTYSAALSQLGTYARMALAAAGGVPADGTAPPGTLARAWTSGDSGMILAEPTGDGRDFTGCTFTWRPVDEYPLPLMLQTVNDFGHFGAELCGFFTRIAARPDGGVDSGGWLHDTDMGRQAFAILEAQGRMGVSADPGPDTEYTETCLEEATDEFGTYCAQSMATFTRYEVIGGTLTPFPGFGKAWVTLEPAAADAAPADAAPPAQGQGGQAVAAAAVLVAPPAARFTMAEPDDDDARYVSQGQGRIAIPLTISDDGHVYGHGAVWGTCHIGYADRCVEPPYSPTSCARFNLGESVAADGSRHATGALVLGLDHAGLHLAAEQARDVYAHTGVAWADVHMTNGRHGYWYSGTLRASVTPELVAVLRGSCLSGDWRTFPDGLDLVAFQAVNVPGFPIARQALAAAGVAFTRMASLRTARKGDRVVTMEGAGVVVPARVQLQALAAAGALECVTCGRDPLTFQDVLDVLAEHGTTLRAVSDLAVKLEARTRHLIDAERAHLRAQLARN